MAARVCGDRDAPRMRLALSSVVLHDLVGVAALVASHPLHVAYALFFARGLLSLACFFSPLLLTTSLLLALLLTVSPAAAGGEPTPSPLPLGLTCGIAVGALRAELRPDGNGGGAVAVLAQLCSFVLGPGDAAAVLRVGEIMGELCDIGDDSCFLLEDDHADLPFHLPWGQEIPIDGEISTDQDVLDETKDGIEEKKVVLELNAPHFPSDNCSSATSDTSLQDMEEQNAIHEQSLVSSDVNGVEEKRLECDPVSVEIRKCDPAAKAKPHSSVSRRILQWEAQASGNFKSVLEEMEGNSVELCLEKGSVVMDFNECDRLESGAYAEKCGEKKNGEEINSVSESGIHQEEQELKDVKECVQDEAETCSEKCSKEQKSEESTLVVQSEQEWQQENLKCILPEPVKELQDEECKIVEPVKELQDEECKIVEPVKELQDQECKLLHSEEEQQEQNSENVVQPTKELQDEQEVQDYQEEFKDADEKPTRDQDPLTSSSTTSIARRVHSRNSSEHHLAAVEGSSPRSSKEKEWKRTLACKLYEERMQLKLCRDRAVVDSGTDGNMDMLWEAYEVGGGGNGAASSAAAKRKAKRSSSKQEQVKETEEEEEDEEDEEEGSVRQLCCLQALKFSTRKMNFGGGGGKPSLAKISKVLRRMAALSRSGSRRSTKG